MMREESSLQDNMIDRNWVLKRKRKHITSGLGFLKGKEETSLPSDIPQCSPSLQKKQKGDDGKSKFADKVKGNDGYYFECVECDIGGNLLCCDSCPRTYHLECLNPPLKRTPPGKWQCPNCCKQKDNVKSVANVEANIKRSSIKNIIEKPKMSPKGPANEKSPPFGKSSIPGTKKGKSTISRRTPTGKKSELAHVGTSASPKSSHSHDGDSKDEILAVEDDKIKDPDISMHLKENTHNQIRSHVKTLNLNIWEKSPEENSDLYKRKMEGKKLNSSFSVSTQKSSKRKSKHSKTYHMKGFNEEAILKKKKRSRAEKGTDRTVACDEPSLKTFPCRETSGSHQKRKPDKHKSACNEDMNMLKPTSRERPEISPKCMNTLSKVMEEQGTQKHKAKRNNEDSWNGLQQVHRILGCRVQRSNIRANENIDSPTYKQQTTSESDPGMLASKLQSYGVDVTENYGKLLADNCSGSEAGTKCDSTFFKGEFGSEIDNVIEEVDEKLPVYVEDNIKKHHNKQSSDYTEVALSTAESSQSFSNLDHSLTNEAITVKEVNPKDVADVELVSAQNDSESCIPGSSQFVKSCDSKGINGEILETDIDAKDKTEALQDSAAKEDGGVIYEFLVKWVGLSNIHSSWVPESQLKVLAKRKLENYKAKYGLAVINICQEQWKMPQRIVSLRISEDGVEEALVKWCGLPYDECTWERLDEPVIKKSAHLLDDLRQYEADALAKDASDDHKLTKGDCQNVLTLDEQPKELKGGLLFPHQLEALNWLRKCWLKSKNVILADEMGLGKTVSACAFLSSLYSEFRAKLPCLVLVPLSTMPNWLAEFASWAPHLNVVEYHGCAKARSIIRQYEWHARGPMGSYKSSKAYKFNVLLTTYEMVLADPSHLSGVPWEVLIVDEGHRLKNSSSKLFTQLNTFSFQHRVLLTGTPLQNNIGEMYNLLNFLQPVSFPSLSAFEEKFNDLTTAEKVEELKKLVAPHMLRRLKKDAMQNIPPKTERMVPVELTSIQAEYYRAMLTKNYQLLRNIGKGGNHQSMLNIVMQLRKVCNHPYLIPGTEPESGSVEFLQEMRIKASAKLTLLHSMLKILHKEGHRILIFSQMTKLLDILEDYLAIEFGSKTFERVDGSVSVADRQAAIARFNQDKSRFVFLLSTRSCGLGINLATADTVIIYDSDFNPHADIQAMNRAHRIGQSNRLLVYRLVVRASVEERILQLAKKKLMLDQLFVNKSGSQKEVEDILRWGTEELFNSYDAVNGQDSRETCTIKADALADGEHKHRRRTGGLGDVYKDKCADGSTKIVWDETAILKLLDRSNLQSASDNTEMDLENDMLGSVKSVDWNDELNEEPVGMELPPNVDGDGCELASEIKEENAVNGTEENEWDKLLRVRWERYQIEEEAALGRGKRLRKAVSYKETFASLPSEASSESGNEEEEPERVYTPAGRALKDKFSKLRARQKERIAQRHITEVPCQTDRNDLLTQSLVQPVQEMESLENNVHEEIEKFVPNNTEDKKLSQHVDANSRIESSARVPKFSRQGYKRYHSDHLDLSVRPPGNFSPNFVLPCNQLQGANISSPMPPSNLLPVLGLCAPNANQASSSRNFRTPPRAPVLKNEQRRIHIGKEESILPPAASGRPCNDMNSEGRDISADASLLPDLSGDSLHLGLKNVIPGSYFPFCPPASVSSGRAIFDAHESSGSSFTSFQEKLGLPNLVLDDQRMPNFPLSSKNLMKQQADLLPSLSLSTNMDYINGSIHDLQNRQNMPVFPDFRQQPSDALKQKKQMTELPSFLGLGPMQDAHASLPENHKKVLDNIILRTQSATNKFFKNRLKTDAWSEDELDALWIGVRRHGRGNWDVMLKDPKLKFSKHRTIEDLSLRWIEEQRKIMDLPEFTAPKQSKHPSFPGISEDMMTRALLGSKFSGLGNEPPKLRSHLTDIQLGCGDLSSSFSPIDPFNHINSKMDDSFPRIAAWQPDKQRSSTGNFSSGPFDGQVKISLPLDQPFQHNLTRSSTLASLDINCPRSCGLQKNDDEFRANKNMHLPSVSDRSLSVIHGSRNNLHSKEPEMEILIGPQRKQILRSFSSNDDITDNSTKTDNLPHWLRQAVNIPPSRPPETELPPNVSAIAQSVRLIYGEDKTIPPFSVPGPRPLQPKDPRRSIIKKRRKLHKLKQVTPDIGRSTMKYDLGASSSIPEVPKAECALDIASSHENLPCLNLNLNSPSSSSIAAEGKNSAVAVLQPPENSHLVASSMSSRPCASPLMDIPGSSCQISESPGRKSLEVYKNYRKDLPQDLKEDHKKEKANRDSLFGDLEKRLGDEQIDEAQSGGSSETHSDPDQGSRGKTKEISSEETASDGRHSEHEQ